MYTNYYVATHWLHGSLILCNEITKYDESIWDNARFEHYVEDEDGNETDIDIYQYYLTSFSESEVEWMEEAFPGILFSYSDMLELWVLCVDHWGTGWDYVEIETTKKNCVAEPGDKLGL